MALVPVVTVDGGAAVLSVDVVLGLVVGWQVDNQSVGPVRAVLRDGPTPVVDQVFGTGTFTGLVDALLQWNLVTASSTHYELARA